MTDDPLFESIARKVLSKRGREWKRGKKLLARSLACLMPAAEEAYNELAADPKTAAHVEGVTSEQFCLGMLARSVEEILEKVEVDP